MGSDKDREDRYGRNESVAAVIVDSPDDELDEDEGIAYESVKIPANWEKRAERVVMAVGFEGGCVHQVDLDGQFLLVNNQVALLDMLDDDDADLRDSLPGVWAQKFASADEREAFLHEQFGHMLSRYRAREVVTWQKAPEPGWYYPVTLGNGDSEVLEVELDDEGNWTRVKLGWVCGCMPVPLDGDFDSDPNTWRLPRAAEWMDRDEFCGHLELARDR